MSRLTAQALMALIITALLIPGWAEGPAIGVAVAPGAFQVDGSRVMGNATLFDGAAVETAQSSTRLRVNPGARVDLAPQSRVTVHGDYVTLEKGSGDLQTARKYQIEARTLRIEPRDPKSVARVGFEGRQTVLVAAVGGPVRVFNHLGLVVADVVPGMAMSFVPQAGPAEGSALAGCLGQTKDGQFILKDDKSGSIVELRGGPELKASVGKRVEVTGTAFRSAVPIAGASSVIRVDALKAVPGDACVPVTLATPPKGTGASPAATSGGGMSAGTKAAIIAVAAGGGIGGIVAATRGSKSR